MSSKTSNGRPSREIYRPRPARKKSHNETTTSVHKQDGDKKRQESRLSDVLSTSFSSSPVCGGINSIDQRTPKGKTIQHVLSIVEEFKSADDKNLILDALDSSKFLSTIQMMKVVRLIHHKALESSCHAYSMTWLSFLIIEKDDNKIFLESLLTCCREWFNQQEGDMRKKVSSSLRSGSSTSSWPPFIAFLREFYHSLQVKRNNLKEKLSGEASSSSDMLLHLQKYSQGLANLLLDSCLLLTSENRLRDSNFSVHLESVISLLRSVGVYLDKENYFKTNLLINNFRLLLLSESGDLLSSMNKKTVMEGIECRASGWMFSQNQQVYYFPFQDG